MAKAVAASKKSGLKKATKPAAAKKRSATVVRKRKVPAKKASVPAKKTSAIKKGAKVSQKMKAGKAASKDMMRYKCRLCGYVYSPLRGEPHNGIPAGTAFEDLPETYVCPICGMEGKGKIGKWGFDEWRPTRYICSMCDYIYDEKRGEPHRGIRPGTKFEDLPDDYICPVCATDPKIVLRYGNVVKQGFSPLYD